MKIIFENQNILNDTWFSIEVTRSKNLHYLFFTLFANRKAVDPF